MKRKMAAALALAGLILTLNAYAEDGALPGVTPEPTVSATATPLPAATPQPAQDSALTILTTAQPAGATPVPEGALVLAPTATPVVTPEPTILPGSEQTLRVTEEYRWFVNEYKNTRGVTVRYYDNVFAPNHGEYGLTPFDSTVPPEYFVVDETGAYALAPIVLDITDAMRVRLYGGDYGETAMYYGQYCERVRGKYDRVGFSGVHEGIDFVYQENAPLYAILGGVVTRAGDSNGTVAIYSEEYDVTLLYLHCEEIAVRRGDEVDAGARIAKEGSKNAGSAYTHVEFRTGRHTSSSPYRDTQLTSDCPYAAMQRALGVTESGQETYTYAQAQRLRLRAAVIAQGAEDAAKAAEAETERLRLEAEAAALAAEEARKAAEAEAERQRLEAEAEAERQRQEAEAEAERLRQEAEAEAERQRLEEEARQAAEEAAQAEETEPPIELIDNLPGADAGYGFGDATAEPQAEATPIPEATLPPSQS